MPNAINVTMMDFNSFIITFRSKECKKGNAHSSTELEKNVKKVREEVVKPLTEDIQGYLSAGHAYGTQATGFIRGKFNARSFFQTV